MRREPFLVLLVRHLVGRLSLHADSDELVDLRQLLGDHAQHWVEVGVVDDDLGVGIVDDELHLWGREPPVRVDADGVQHCRSVEHLEMLDRVLVEEDDAIARADTGSGKRLSGPCRTFEQLAPGARPLSVDDRYPVWASLGVVADNVGDGVDLRHRGELRQRR